MKGSFTHVAVTDDFSSARIAVGICGSVDGVNVEDDEAMVGEFGD